MKIARVKRLTKIYKVSRREIYAVNNVSFTVDEQEFLILFGPSGSGKSTLLMLLAALIKPSRGKIYFKMKILQILMKTGQQCGEKKI